MLIFAIDDEPRALRVLHNAIAKAAPSARIMDYPLGTTAVEAIEEQGLRPDAVFSDIKMPGLDGLALAVRIKQASPDTKIVFVTAYSEYALDAIHLRATGYLMKPVEPERVREELEFIAPALAEETGRLRIRCFGSFEVFWNDRPLLFERRQTKELLAYLVDREGAVCTAEEIASVLWEDETDMRAAKHRLRQLVNDLKKTLVGIGMEDLLIRRSGQLAIRRDGVDCDYYRMLGGDMQAANAYRGEYMEQYSWAEFTAGRLFQQGK